MSIFAWIIVGLIAGFLARLVLPGEEPGPRGVVGDLIAGIVGGIVGGLMFRVFGMGGLTGINVGSMVIAFVGAVIFLIIWRAIDARTHGTSAHRPA